MIALDDLIHFQLALGYTANAVGVEVGVTGLDAEEVLMALLFPFDNEFLVHIDFLDAVLVQFSTDGSLLVEEVKYVACFLVVDPKDGPEGLHLPLSLVKLNLSFSQLLIKLVQSQFNCLPARIWRCFSATFDFRHSPLRNNSHLDPAEKKMEAKSRAGIK